jgi:histidinol-phosphate/aromatic aminotransferase/cobyric acid decarboxylase-like protein
MNNNLLECVDALKDVRRCMQNDADPSIVAALSAAITKLESCATDDGPTPRELGEAALGALGVISDIVIVFNGIAELVQHLRA